MRDLEVGETIYVGRNSAKALGDTCLHNTPLRVEAKGIDWVVIRCPHGFPYSATCYDTADVVQFMKDVRRSLHI